MTDNGKNIVLDINRFNKTFHVGFFRKRVEAVRDVGFKVRKGEIFGLLGPNGAGKTTTLKMLMDLVRPDAGEALIFGVSHRKASARTNLGYLPENPYFYDYLKPMELLAFYGKLLELPAAEIRERSAQLIAKVGLTDAKNRTLKKFSKGMLQRVGLAQALMNKPELLILDEPMSGLDPIGRKFVTDLILDLNKAGTTIVFSSHILSDVERLCHRVTILNNGRNVADGTLEQLLRDSDGKAETLESLFIRKAMALEDSENQAPSNESDEEIKAEIGPEKSNKETRGN